MNEKIKAINPQIVVHGTPEKPYYEISYYDTTDNKWHIGYSSYDLQTVKEYLENCFEIIETDVEPVKHGRWLINSDGYYPYCSECKCEPDGRKMSKYCPHCGAKMDGKEVQE